MNKKQKQQQFNNLSQILPELLEFPEITFSKIIRSPSSFYSKDGAESFWHEYQRFYNLNTDRFTPEVIPYFEKLRGHHLFYTLNKLYETEIVKLQKAILKYHPSFTTLLKTIFLTIELGKLHHILPLDKSLPAPTKETLQAAKDIIGYFMPLLTEEDGNNYTEDLGELVLNLLRYTSEKQILLNIHDEYLWSDFSLQQNVEGDGFIITPEIAIPKKENKFILYELKRKIKQDYQFSLSFQLLSNEAHFRQIDLIWKTNEGPVTTFHSPGIQITHSLPGTTNKEMSEDFFQSVFENTKPSLTEDELIRLTSTQLEAAFHYHLRTSLAESYKPNDVVDVKQLCIKIDKESFSVYELFCAISCLSAYAENLCYINSLSQFDIPSLYERYKASLEVKSKQWNPETILKEFTFYIFKQYGELEEKEITAPFFILKQEKLLEIFRKAEELKSFSDQKLMRLIDLFSSFENSLPYNPLYKTNERYFIEGTSLTNYSYIRILYDYYVTAELFSNKKVEEKHISGNRNHIDRETKFNNAVKETFQHLTTYCTNNVKFGYIKGLYEIGDLKGDIDVLVYFKEENLLVPIQVKLSNAYPRKERRKFVWVDKNIKEKGKEQVQKDIALINQNEGLRLISDALGVSIKEQGLSIIPLLVTDNFYADHQFFTYNDNGDSFLCVSYFELHHLVLNERIHPKQIHLPPFSQTKSGFHLMDLLKRNVFWGFIDEMANEYKQLITLESLNKPHTITRVF